MITEINKHGRQPEKLVPTITIETTFIVTREDTQKTNKLKMKTTACRILARGLMFSVNA